MCRIKTRVPAVKVINEQSPVGLVCRAPRMGAWVGSTARSLRACLLSASALTGSGATVRYP